MTKKLGITFAGVLAALWTIYTYQNEHKPILVFESIEGQVIGSNNGKQIIAITFKTKKEGSALSKNTEVFTSFLDFIPGEKGWQMLQIDQTFSDFPDFPNKDNRPFTIEKYIPIKYFVEKNKFPGFMPFVLAMRWQGDGWLYKKREFSFTSLFHVTPRLANINDKTTTVFDFKLVDGPEYFENVFWNRIGQGDFLNRTSMNMFRNENINTIFDIDSFIAKGGKSS